MTGLRCASTIGRVPRGLALAAVLFLVALAVPLTPGITTPARADTGGTTKEGMWHRWNPVAVDNGDGTYTGALDTSSRPTVHVDQTENLIDQVVHVSWSGFTPSSNENTYYGSGLPSSFVPLINQTTLYPVRVYECAGVKPAVPPSDLAHTRCYVGTADPASADEGHGQGNEVTATTASDGTGAIDFHVENQASNDLLGCDPADPCSLVVVPSNGGREPFTPTASEPVDCADHSSDFLGGDYDQYDFYATGAFGSQCDWADRIVVPLHFAPLPGSCPGGVTEFTAVGSPMLGRGLDQLRSGWCNGKTNPLFFDDNATTNEYVARSSFGASGALTAATDIALVTQPADPTTVGDRKFTYAPIVNNAVSIPYYIDNVKTGQPMTDIRLDARLVAKLLTQSYQPYIFSCQGTKDKTTPSAGCAPEIAGNPTSILYDPEFQRLNMGKDQHPDHPDLTYFPTTGTDLQFFPTVVAGDSDATFELTRWIADDPDASAFLKGKTDGDGMHVNRYYLTSHGAPPYPISQFQAQDPGWTASKPRENRLVEGLQATWNPQSGWDRLATTLVGNSSTALDGGNGKCSNDQDPPCTANPSTPVNFGHSHGESLGARGLVAVTDNSAAQAYRFPTAQLVNDHGEAVAPTTRSMTDAVTAMRTNPDKITQYVDHHHEAADGYPVTTVDYAMVPTCGLSNAKAAAISSFLQHVIDSQTYGVEPGTIAPGLVGLTGAQLKQVAAAKNAVSTQSCTSPPPDTTIAGRPHPHTGSSTFHGGGGANRTGNSGGTTTGGGTPTRTPGAAPTSRTATSGPAVSRVSASPVSKNDAGRKPGVGSGSFGLLVPLVLGIGLAFLIGGPLAWWMAATPAGRGVARQLRTRGLVVRQVGNRAFRFRR